MLKGVRLSDVHLVRIPHGKLKDGKVHLTYKTTFIVNIPYWKIHLILLEPDPKMILMNLFHFRFLYRLHPFSLLPSEQDFLLIPNNRSKTFKKYELPSMSLKCYLPVTISWLAHALEDICNVLDAFFKCLTDCSIISKLLSLLSNSLSP